MKKLIAVIVLIAFTGSIHAQWYGKRIKGNGNMITKTRTVSDYDAISVAGSFDVKLVAGNEGNLTIHIDENLLEYLETEVNGDNLKISWKKGVNISTHKKILITVPFVDIERVSLAGSGDVYSDDVIKATEFKISLAGSGDVKLHIAASDISSSIVGSGDVDLRGNATSIRCSISGSGDIDAYQLTSDKADVSISGSGGVKISVKDNLKARISGTGNVYYKGNPKYQDFKVSGSGSVSSR
tara:strand:+ start:1245 stop:1964 length:720 start_codon:yes stop_codon:yes gene_type:complete